MKYQVVGLFSLKNNEEIFNTGVCSCRELILSAPKMKIVEFANSVDPDEVAHNEPPDLGLHCLPSLVFDISIRNSLDETIFFNSANVNFVVC